MKDFAETDASEIEIKVARQSSATNSMLSLSGRQDDIMPYNGRFGIDVHAQDAANGDAWRWIATSGGGSMRANSTLTLDGLPAGSRKYTVYFPTHIPVSSLQIGVPEESKLTPYCELQYKCQLVFETFI